MLLMLNNFRSLQFIYKKKTHTSKKPYMWLYVLMGLVDGICLSLFYNFCFFISDGAFSDVSAASDVLVPCVLFTQCV